VPSLTVNEYVLVTDGVAVGFCALVEDNAGPLHVNTVALPDGFAVRVIVAPLHITPLFIGAATGFDLTVTAVVYTVEGTQPDAAVPLVTVNEYVLVTVGVAVGLASVEEERFGPLHEYTVVLPPGFAVSVTVPPSHIGPLFVGAAVGVALTVTVVVYIVVGAQPGEAVPSETVNE
jgi:hypothetical protein